MEKKKKIRILPGRNDQDGTLFVSVNDRTWLIKKGEVVEVPLCVVEVLSRQNQVSLVEMGAE